MQKNFTIKPLKILITGKSGVGKSTFANFLFGREVFKTGIGKPVTKGIQKTEFKINNTPIEIIDTEGLEPNNISDIKNKIKTLVDSNQFLSPTHGIFYLINAASARIEEFEINYIKELHRYNIPISIILTHIDIATKEQLENLKKLIDREFMDIATNKNFDNFHYIFFKHPILNIDINILKLTLVTKKLRGRKQSSLSKEKLNLYRKNLIETFFKIYAKYYLYYNIFELIEFIKRKIENIKNKAIKSIEEADLSIFNITEWEEKLDRLMEEADKFFDNEFKKFDYIEKDFTNLFNNIANDIGINIEDTIDFSFLDELLDLEEDIVLKKISTIKSVEENIDNIDNDETSIFQKTLSIINLGTKALRIETTLKNIVNEFYREINLIIDEIENKIIENMKNEEWNIENHQ